MGRLCAQSGGQPLVHADGWAHDQAGDCPGGVIYAAIDPGQHGAVAAVRVASPGAGQVARVVAAAVAHAGGRHGYQGQARHLDSARARAALRAVCETVGQAPHTLVALESLGLRPGESVVSTSTASVGHGVWRGVLGLAAADLGWAWREVQTQQVDRAMGLQPVGRTLRKSLVIYQTIEALTLATGAEAADWRRAMVPVGGRVISDGAGDALWMCLAMARGL